MWDLETIIARNQRLAQQLQAAPDKSNAEQGETAESPPESASLSADDDAAIERWAEDGNGLCA